MLFNFFFFKKFNLLIKQNFFFVFNTNNKINKTIFNLKKSNIFLLEKYSIEFIFFYIYKKFIN